MELKQGCWATALDFKLCTATWICLKRRSSKYIYLQWASRGLRLKTSMSKASSFLKPLSGKSWAACHRAMEFSAVTPTAQHFPTPESRTNQPLFSSAQCNPSLLLINRPDCAEPQGSFAALLRPGDPPLQPHSIRSSILLPLMSSFSDGPSNARSRSLELLWGDGKVTP